MWAHARTLPTTNLFASIRVPLTTYNWCLVCKLSPLYYLCIFVVSSRWRHDVVHNNCLQYPLSPGMYATIELGEVVTSSSIIISWSNTWLSQALRFLSVSVLVMSILVWFWVLMFFLYSHTFCVFFLSCSTMRRGSTTTYLLQSVCAWPQCVKRP